MTSTTSAIEVLSNIFASLDCLKKWFQTMGHNTHPVNSVLRGNGIKQSLVPAYHPVSDGAAERSVQTVQSALKKQALADKESITLQHSLENFLLMYRSTADTITGVSPAELFLKCQMRTWFSRLKPSLTVAVEEKQQSQKKYHDEGRTKFRKLAEGDLVHVRVGEMDQR